MSLSHSGQVPNPGDPQALNRLAYALNNPVGLTDPGGHYAVKDNPGDTWGVRRGERGAGYAVGIEWWGELEEFEGPSTAEFVATVTSPFWGGLPQSLVAQLLLPILLQWLSRQDRDGNLWRDYSSGEWIQPVQMRIAEMRQKRFSHLPKSLILLVAFKILANIPV